MERTFRVQLADTARGVVQRTDPELPVLLMEVERLSATHSARIGARSLDVLHVAAALVLGAGEFVTFDQRQSRLARAVGLTVPDFDRGD